jgi:hypothetical protein
MLSSEAAAVLLRLGDTVGDGGEMDVLTATEHLARGRRDAARRRLGPVLDGAVPCLLPVTLQQAWLVETLLALSAGQRARCHDALCEAVRMADERGAFRAFLDLPGIVDLLDEDASRFGRLDPVVDRISSMGHLRVDHAFVPMTGVGRSVSGARRRHRLARPSSAPTATPITVMIVRSSHVGADTSRAKNETCTRSRFCAMNTTASTARTRASTSPGRTARDRRAAALRRGGEAAISGPSCSGRWEVQRGEDGGERGEADHPDRMRRAPGRPRRHRASLTHGGRRARQTRDRTVSA